MAALIAYCVSLVSKALGTYTTPERNLSDEIQPFVKHRTLTYEDFKSRDILVVGDVHGCYDEAMELIQKVKSKSTKKFIIIFVGDMVNKGRKNYEMLDYIRTEKDVYCVRGNHEQAVVRLSLAMKEKPDFGKESKNWFSKISPEQFEFLRNLPYTISIPMLNMIVVHAGLQPHIAVHQQEDRNMISMRRLMWKKDDFHGKVLTPTNRHEGYLWAQCWPGPEHVYFGHDAIIKLQREEHSTGLDTGCLYGGKLTAVLIKVPDNLAEPIEHNSLEREFFSVEAKEAYVKVD